MKRTTRLLALLPLMLAPLAQAEEQVSLETSMGNIQIELYADEAPKTVANFLEYVNSGYYDGLIFHRVIPGFMIQGGGMNAAMQTKPNRPPVENESDNGLSNERGTLAMARTRDPDSADSQFFINTVNNSRLDGMPGKPGYTVFGKVVSGMDVVDRIGGVDTTTRAPFRDVPVTPVVIEKAVVISTP
ncbi:peptidylprolyl isomerase [Marinobacterium mangrovicola]|uniref:Peptidyl-prolyl cis-trans isomerase n=1 Tax=Marinobacterium mangrovicola TaxID=1476959 RepID=A0A4R1GM49_9GAMM|nr:peptidylprolyl isomerase [Marinobacterium mangrovicola]TCK08120.1 peptidyl-prolyl cis-trans isomerase A (cyclophilin A) [Marinobacterium mangrovicola]